MIVLSFMSGCLFSLDSEKRALLSAEESCFTDSSTGSKLSYS